MSIEWQSLTDICRPKQWKTISGKDLLSEGYPVYGANGIIGYWSEYNHKHETITIACRGTCGTVNIVPAKSYINGNAMCLDGVSDSINSKFLYYYLKGYDFKEIITGTTIPQITIEGLRKVKIPCLSLEKQEEIVHVFDRVVRLISIRKDEIVSLDSLIKARFVEMFDNDTFQSVPLIETIKKGAGLSYGIVVPGDNLEEGIPMVRPSDFKNGRLDLSNVYRVDPEIEKKYARTRLIGDEVLVQVIGQPGQVMLADEDCRGMNVTRNLAVIRPEHRITNRFYLKYFIEKEESQFKLLNDSKQSTLKQLPLSRLKQLDIILPPIELQNKFGDFFKQVDKSKAAVHKALDEAQLLFDSLMQKYFG